MRVISGTARGRKLLEPADRSVRPTTDMVKEAIFNIVQFDVEGRQVLDLFAGTGQLGVEAASRGAAHVTFVDAEQASVRLVLENLRRTGLEEAASVVRGDALSFLEHGGKYDLVFLDPPYDAGLLEKALEKAIAFDILKDNGIIVCESRIEQELPPVAPPYVLRRAYRYGKIKLTVYDRLPAEQGKEAQGL